MPPSPNAWTVFPSPNPSARLRLFCFPYAGGGATIYSRWAPLLPPDVEVVAVQLPGRERRLMEKPFSDVKELVARMHEELQPHFDRPFAFYGHSNGGLMAFELTRSLRRAGAQMPLALLVGGKQAPQLPVREPPIHALPDAEFMQELRQLGGTPEGVLENEEIMQLLTPMLRADFSLGETYRYTPEPPLDLPVRAYGGRLDEEVTEVEIEAWREQAAGDFRWMMFPGGHFFINGEDREAVLRELSAELRALPASRTHGG